MRVVRSGIFFQNPFYLCAMALHATKREDTYLHQGRRRKLIDTLREKGITDEKVLAAMEKIPRHFFLDPAFTSYAYQDQAFPIGSGQTISHPYTVAFQSQLLQVRPFEKVLEVGTGSAYQSCVLAEMGATVYTIERQRTLFEYNNNFFFLKNYLSNIKRFYGDGFEGLPAFAPFHKIIITAAAPAIPLKLIEQLMMGGILVAPVDSDIPGIQKMMRFVKTPTGFDQEILGDFSFVPMLSGKENTEKI